MLFAVGVLMKMKKYLKKKNQLRYQKLLVELKIYDHFKNLAEENISQQLRLKQIDNTRNYFFEEMKQNELISKKP